MFLLAGKTGSKKTQTVLNILHQMQGTFDELYIFSLFGDGDKLYRFCHDHFLGKCMVTDDIDQLPEVADLDPTVQRAFVFDDVQVLPTKIQRKIEKYFCTVRQKNGSCFYVAQNFHSVPKVIRAQASYIFLLPHSSDKKDFRTVASHFGDADQIEAMYKHCGDVGSFFWIDTRGKNEQRYRCGFDEVLLPHE